MSSTAASGFVFLLLSVQVIQSMDTWGVIYTSTDICGVIGSSVEISCRYTYPSTIQDYDIRKTFWFTKEKNGQPVDLMSDSQYTGRVKNECQKNRCTLIISDLRKSDRARYTFRFTTNNNAHTGSPGVTLAVTDPGLEVMVSKVDSTRVGLMCQSMKGLPDKPLKFYWYKDGVKIETRSSSLSVSFGSSNSYSCAVQGQENICSPPVFSPKLPSVSVSPSNEIMEGSSVTLTCSSDANPAASYSWHKVNQNLDIKTPQLVFSSIKSSDSGWHYCEAVNQMGTKSSELINIGVNYAPKFLSVSVSPSDEIMEGSSVTLNCSSDANPAASYTWSKEKQKLLQGPEGVYRFTSISSKDSGIYYCKSENKHGEVMSPALPLDVQYPPRLPSVSMSPPDEIMEGSLVTLTCSSDANPPASYTWYKGKKKLLQVPKGVYRFSSISSKDRGTYYCKPKNKHGSITSSALVVNVLYAPKLPSVSVSPSEIVEGSLVTLTCSSDANPAASYTWYKMDEDLPKASGRIFTITNFTDEHSGIYSCEAKNTRGRSNSTFHLSVAAPAAVVDIITMVLQIIYWILAVLVLSSMILFFLWLRKKKAVISTTEPDEYAETLELDVYHTYENFSDDAAQPEDTEDFKDYTLQIYDKLLELHRTEESVTSEGDSLDGN